MFMSISLYVSLAVFFFASLYKISRWFRLKVGIEARDIPVLDRLREAFKGIFATLLSRTFFVLLKVLILDVLLQFRILREDRLRWVMHILIYGGFILLLLLHALDKQITAPLWEGYTSTLNPFLFLRNLFGALVMIGVGVSIYRRFILKVPRLFTHAMDIYALLILAVIIVSGIFLEGTKMVAHSEYQRMVDEYSGLSDPEELQSLETYWVKEFGLVSPSVGRPLDGKRLQKGEELHRGSCVGCHDRAPWAFMGYGVAKVIRPVGLGIDRARLPALLWYLHVMSCLLGLAYLPFSKMFHIVASSASLLVNRTVGEKALSRANRATLQAIELDACTHCGTCNLRCSVVMAFGTIQNVNILPSEKMVSIKTLASGKKLHPKEFQQLLEGITLCTNCYRCTVVCPAGINLQELWLQTRERLLQEGDPEFLVLSPLSFYRGLIKEERGLKDYERPLLQARKAIASQFEWMRRKDWALPLTITGDPLQQRLNLSAQAKTFSACFGCQTCTTVCPVVGNYENPQEVLGLLPHQIMHAVGLGLRDLALGSNMLWDCLTCYQCQEQCPQGVSVTDVLYELKNMAIQQVREKTA